MPVWRTYQNAVLRVRCTPKTRSNLELLIASYSDLMQSYQGVLDSLPKARDPYSDPIASRVHEMRRQVEVYKGLRYYETEAGKKRIYHLVKCRFERRGNAELAHLVSHHAMERVDPLNQKDPDGDLQKKFDNWLKTLGDQDPSEHIVDFLFQLDQQALDYRCPLGMTQSRLDGHEVKAHGGKLLALYVTDPGRDEPVRYMASSGGAAASVSSIRRDLLNTGAKESAERGGDFLEGDPYVLSPDDKLYSVNIKKTVHSEFLAGDAVKGAGLWVVKKGRVHLVDNRSGHYKPSWRGLLQTVEHLAQLGVLHPNAAVGFVKTEHDVMYFRVQDFIRLGKADFPYEATLAVLRGYHRMYEGRIPVEAEQRVYLPPCQLNNWETGKRDRWDNWMIAVFGAWHSGETVERQRRTQQPQQQPPPVAAAASSSSPLSAV